jgi:hypothetical protein
MFSSVSTAMFTLMAAALLCYERLRALYVAVVYWASGGAMRYVPRDCGLRRSRARPGELCACDVRTPNGSVLRTLCRGTDRVDIDADTRYMKAFQSNVLAVEPHAAWAPESALAPAREFLMTRCAGYASTSATVSEVVALMEAAAGQGGGSFEPRLTLTLADFEELCVEGGDFVASERTCSTG